MKRKILLLSASALFFAGAYAQKTSVYAITGPQKGARGWAEVRTINVETGEEVRGIYKTGQDVEILNVRTGKPVQQVQGEQQRASQMQPFATTSAACAYDKKHQRLYFTPMGINQLRYIDLKSKHLRIYYFEDEAFGTLKNARDIPRQITRMAIASDGNGYALTNNAEHLIRFTTGRKPEITDLGNITDDPSNTVLLRNAGFGGDMVADDKKNLYLITAYRHVYRISIETRVATYLGAIRGLPRGFTTNGAAVEEGTSVLVTSSNSTTGYFRFDIESLQAEMVSSGAPVYNASDLANANLITFKKKKKDREDAKQEPEAVVATETAPAEDASALQRRDQAPATGKVSVYPNPVTSGTVRLFFEDQPAGRYQVQFTDISGKVISTRQYTISGNRQTEEFSLPDLIAAGNYMFRVENLETRAVTTSKVVVQ